MSFLLLLKTVNTMKKPKSICTLKITQPNYLRYQVVAQREYFIHDGYGYSAIITFLERGLRQKKKMVALKEERLKEEKPIPYGDCCISWRQVG